MKHLFLLSLAFLPALSAAQAKPAQASGNDLTYLVLMPCSGLTSALSDDSTNVKTTSLYSDANGVLFATFSSSHEQIAKHIDEVWAEASRRCKADPNQPFFATLMDSAKPYMTPAGL